MPTYDFNLTRNELIEASYRKFNGIAEDESLSGYQLNKGIQTLNTIIREVDGASKHLWAISMATITLAANTHIYTTSNGLASGILELVTVSYRNSSAEDSPCEILTVEGYELIANKNDTGDTIKVYLDVNKTLSSRTLYIWPAPNTVQTQSEVTGTDALNYRCIKSHGGDSTNRPITGANWKLYWEQAGLAGVAWVTGTSYYNPELLRYQYKRPLYDFDVAGDNPDMPQAWNRFLIYALASDLADDNTVPLPERLYLASKAKGALSDIFRITVPVTTDYHNKSLYF